MTNCDISSAPNQLDKINNFGALCINIGEKYFPENRKLEKRFRQSKIIISNIILGKILVKLFTKDNEKQGRRSLFEFLNLLRIIFSIMYKHKLLLFSFLYFNFHTELRLMTERKVLEDLPRHLF